MYFLLCVNKCLLSNIFNIGTRAGKVDILAQHGDCVIKVVWYHSLY
jgi:hypothetical protein